MNGVLRFALLFTLIVYPRVCVSQEIISLKMLSRQCIKIWRMMGDLVEQRGLAVLQNTDDTPYNDFLDEIICDLVRVRDMIAQVPKEQDFDPVVVEYVASSLDCIESYGHDLVQYYPGSWSAVIQDQIMRTQEEYEQAVVPLITK